MASNVVVMHNNRRYVVKTTPSMLCREVLNEACQKIGFKEPELYGLKNGKNTVDLSLPLRLSNLPAGAKLDIYKITASEASKPITLALQCSDPPIRLTGTFPPTATLTELLLHFEQESNGQLNIFGRRGMEAVLSVLGREFTISEGSTSGGTTTLAGMGVGGNVLVRLGFRKVGSASSSFGSSVAPPVSQPRSPAPSRTPTSNSSSETAPRISLPPAQSSPPTVSSPPAQVGPPTASPSPLTTPPTPPVAETASQAEVIIPEPESTPSDMMTDVQRHTTVNLPPSTAVSEPPPPPEPFDPRNRNPIVYSAASGAIPAAAKLEHDESLYNMTTEQAKGYQAHLTATAKSYNERVLMTKDMRDALDREKALKRAFTQCDVRIRFPDGTQIQATFGANETIGDIYDFVRGYLSTKDVPFQLHLMPKGDLAEREIKIKDAGFANRTLVMFTWERKTGVQVLRDEVLKNAVEIEGVAKELLEAEVRTKEEKAQNRNQQASTSTSKPKNEGSSSGGGGKIPKWFGKFSKK